MVLYIVLGILVWILGSLTATWLFTYMTGSVFRNGIFEDSGYIFFILCWPFIFVGISICLIIDGWLLIMKYLSLWLGRLNPLRIWDKVAIHGAKRGRQ